MRSAAAALLLFGVTSLLPGCSGTDNWKKPGATSEAASSDLAECRSEAEAATARDAQIDTDIMATRSGDWQRTGTLGAKRSTFTLQGEGRAQDVLDHCMRAKGYAPAS